METITEKVTLVVETCCKCGTPFGMEKNLQQQRRETNQVFYCPNGHGQHYTGETTEAKIRKLNDQLEEQQAVTQWWKEEAEIKAAQLKSTRSALTKTKNRIAKGICPCCHRQFTNLERHMAGQHPEYNGDTPD